VDNQVQQIPEKIRCLYIAHVSQTDEFAIAYTMQLVPNIR